jgi:hypothetical protein
MRCLNFHQPSIAHRKTAEKAHNRSNRKRYAGMSQHAGNARSLSFLKVGLRIFFQMHDLSAMAIFEYGSLPRNSTARESGKIGVV